MKEITWYGRGGQGAFTASRVLGASAIYKGFKSLAFPSFGPERRGAPIRAFTKISDKRIVDRSIIKKNDYIIVLDDSLYTEGMLEELKPGGHLLLNTKKEASHFTDERIIAGDITTNAELILKRPIVNIGILGLLIGRDKDIDLQILERSISEYMPAKVAGKNIELLRKIYEISGGEKND
ncbi:pyruvate ferredoxin oxidoreductase gamma subunit [Lachnospiraceae bacterium NE2001]|nr:pyruvate ferredoxin oxidoreductase gamma subunit [Lachnospiraceae bacterium NE2001]